MTLSHSRNLQRRLDWPIKSTIDQSYDSLCATATISFDSNQRGAEAILTPHTAPCLQLSCYVLMLAVCAEKEHQVSVGLEH